MVLKGNAMDVITPYLNRHLSIKVMRSNKGFTLIELVMTTILIGIVMAVVVLPRYVDLRHEASKANLLGSLAGMNEGINQYTLNSRIQGTSPSYPPTLPDAMNGGIVPDHPEGISGISNVQTASNTWTNPAWRVLKSGVAGAFWYNSFNGIVRARVSDQGTEALTVIYYNEVNKTNISGMGNYGGGGGGS